MCNAARERHQAFQFLPGERFLLNPFELRDIDGRADVAGEAATGREAGDPLVEQPAELPIGATKTVLHFERLSSLTRRIVNCQAPLAVVGMHSLSPGVAPFVFQRVASKGQPGFVEENTPAIRTGNP